ncbi:SDR family NAD(P)-dependent oxidoreductase [Alteribacillus sp. YIM 98480]|uniref:SDR family NAD(P)-dependent oxidoreductase n=1 Tax=Alteribacillus sp. YIM 98480 TaxID=2606599 RepID=UPI00131B80B8|nr:glucose 1-dehydrogenase [Alteribacillus sp. YIM 98480]
MELNKQVVLVTGAGKGIGKATALTLGNYGVNVIATDINVGNIKKTSEEIKQLGGQSTFMEMDVSKKKQVDVVVDSVINKFKKIDILVNCAGAITSGFLVNLDEKKWDQIMDINTKGVFLTSQAVAKNMIQQKHGTIVNISSVASKTGEVGNGVYSVSKAAVNMLTQTYALELAPYNINVNAICPGYTDTDIMQDVFEKRGPIEGVTPDKYREMLISNVPLQRMAKPEEIGELIAFIVSDKANYITGATINIAGGKEVH